MRSGPHYVDGRYVAERRGNPFVQKPKYARILSAAMLPWFMLRPPKGCGVLTTTGRKTGKPRARCVRAYRRGEKVYMVAIGGEHNRWLKNIRANPNVRLRIRGGVYDGVARDVRDPDERTEVEAAFCESIVPFDYLENRAHRMGRPTRKKIVELHRAWLEGGVPLVVELRTAIRDASGRPHRLLTRARTILRLSVRDGLAESAAALREKRQRYPRLHRCARGGLVCRELAEPLAGPLIREQPIREVAHSS